MSNLTILIGSLQVSTSGSKGHFHPALELAIACKKKHRTVLFPLPSPLSPSEQKQLVHLGIEYIEPPKIHKSIFKSAEQLAVLATDPKNTWQAYYSFLLAPLIDNFQTILETIKILKPDIVIYDMLAYGTALAARKLDIPDIGYCAGLKLVAPDMLLEQYKGYKEQLDKYLFEFLSLISIQARFRNLELLSNFGHAVFSVASFIQDLRHMPMNTHLVGPLPISLDRIDCTSIEMVDAPDDNYGLLSFGSVFDPADFPNIIEPIFESTKQLCIPLLVSSKKFSRLKNNLPHHVKAYPYLHLPKLLPRAKFFIHHGGANSFSEGLTLGIPQILIPLTTDQPIQAHYLAQAGIGAVIKPHEVDRTKLHSIIEQFLNPKDSIHELVRQIAQQFKNQSGAANTINLAESAVKNRST